MIRKNNNIRMVKCDKKGQNFCKQEQGRIETKGVKDYILIKWHRNLEKAENNKALQNE